MSRDQLGALVIVGIIGAIVYFGYIEDGSKSKEPVEQSVDRTTTRISPWSSLFFVTPASTTTARS